MRTTFNHAFTGSFFEKRKKSISYFLSATAATKLFFIYTPRHKCKCQVVRHAAKHDPSEVYT